MIFDLIAPNGNVMYLYKSGEILPKIIFRDNIQCPKITITNTEDYLEIYLNDEDTTDDCDLIFGDSENYENARIDLTGYHKLTFTVVAVQPEKFTSNRFYITQNYRNYDNGKPTTDNIPDPNGGWDYFSRITLISVSGNETVYEIDISDLDGEYYVGLRISDTQNIYGVNAHGYIRISNIKLE